MIKIIYTGKNLEKIKKELLFYYGLSKGRFIMPEAMFGAE